MHAAQDFDAFVAVVDAGSISAAARALRVPRATLSRQLARLESRLGVRLLTRSPRQLTLTRAGEALYPRARGLLDASDAAVAAVQRLDDVPRGLLRVSSAPLSAPSLGALVARYLQQYPEVQVELRTSTRHVDLAAEQIDVAVRGGVLRGPSLITRRLLGSEMIAVASPDYLDAHGVPVEASDLAAHNCLRGFVSGVREATAWPCMGGGAVPVDGTFTSNDPIALLGAALAGLGVALLPRPVAASALEERRLIHVLADRVGLSVTLSMVWLERAFIDPKVRAFVDLAVAWAAEGRFAVDTSATRHPANA